MCRKTNKESVSLTEIQKEKLKSLFPNVFSEEKTSNGEIKEKIDFDKLKSLLGENISNKKDRYNFEWAGKQEAILGLQKGSKGTLVPQREESIKFEDSENIFIEGENLEVLKLLQKSYNNSLEQIIIDPPYNSGSDFVYEDDFKENKNEYLSRTDQIDKDGYKTTTNSETNGRYHSNWLNMMYPRLVLARNLLKEDGLIFVHIDDREVAQLKLLMDEVFGEENFVAKFVWKSKGSGAYDTKGIVSEHEYVLLYSKDINKINIKKKEYDTSQDSAYKHEDFLSKKGGEYKRQALAMGSLTYSPSLDYAITCPDKTKIFPGGEKGEPYIWRYSKKKFKKSLEKGLVEFVNTKNGWSIYTKQYEFLDNNGNKITRTVPHKTIIDNYLNRQGTENLKKIFNEKVFDYPKPVDLIKFLINLHPNKNAKVLDFFAGSGTLAHAVLELNQEDGGNRKFINVQLPEATDHKEYNTIADISKERIRRVINGYGDKEPINDGFKVFKLQPSNYKIWEDLNSDELSIKDLKQQINLFENSLVKDYKDIDVLYEIVIKEGFSLNSKIDKEKNLYKITDKENSFYVCLDERIGFNILNNIKYDKETLFICLDSAINDTTKENLFLKLNLKTI